MQVALFQRVGVGRLRRSRVSLGGSGVAQDRRVEPASESGGSDVGVGTNPVVGDGLVGGENERVALPSEDLNAVYRVWLDIDTVDFDNGLGRVSVGFEAH